MAATAVLVPNTLATGFGIPDLDISYIWVIPILVVATGISVVVTYRWTKQYRVLPFGRRKLSSIRNKFRK